MKYADFEFRIYKFIILIIIVLFTKIAKQISENS